MKDESLGEGEASKEDQKGTSRSNVECKGTSRKSGEQRNIRDKETDKKRKSSGRLSFDQYPFRHR